MREETFALDVGGSNRLHAYRWSSEHASVPRAAVQVVHGMAEHSARYVHVAQALVDAGYVVYAADHRGHGKSAQTDADLGYFADRDGWQAVIADMFALNQRIAREQPSLPRLLIAHSMGSMLARDFLTVHGDAVQAVVLSGTSAPAGVLAKVGALIARGERYRLGARGRSKLLEAMSTGEYNRAFAPNRTGHDWLSRDNAEVDRYINDPRCGFDFTVQGWIDVLHGVSRIEDPALITRIPHQLPILITSGDRDPLGKNGRGIEKLATLFRNAGLQRVEVKLYTDARHEIFNETNRAEVIADVIQWLHAQVATVAVAKAVQSASAE